MVIENHNRESWSLQLVTIEIHSEIGVMQTVSKDWCSLAKLGAEKAKG